MKLRARELWFDYEARKVLRAVDFSANKEFLGII